MSNITKLQTLLLNTGLQNKDHPLYDFLSRLLGELNGVSNATSSIVVNNTPGPAGPQGIPGFAFSSDDSGGGGDSLGLPGPAGSAGAAGATGAQGPMGVPGFGFDGEDGDPPLALPGAQGNPGVTGAQGPMGAQMVPEDVFFEENIFIVNQPTIAGGSVPWSLFASNTSISGVNVFNYTGLAAYTEVQVFVRGITFGVSDRPIVQVSVDNGANYLTSVGDYIGVGGNTIGITNYPELEFGDATNSTSAHYGAIWIANINLTAPKIARATFFGTDFVNLRYIPTANTITAIRVKSLNGNNFTAGDIYVFAR